MRRIWDEFPSSSPETYPPTLSLDSKQTVLDRGQNVKKIYTSFDQVNFIRINLHNLDNALFDFENFSFQFLFITLSASSFDVSFLTRKLIIMLSKSVNS